MDFSRHKLMPKARVTAKHSKVFQHYRMVDPGIPPFQIHTAFHYRTFVLLYLSV